MSESTQEVNRNLAAEATNVVKEHFSIAVFNVQYDLHCFISQTAKVRKLQKRYYAAQDKQTKQYLLIECKRAEATLDKLGNYLWTKYKLQDIPYSPLYRIG